MIVFTENSMYEFDFDNMTVRRSPAREGVLRKDGEAVPLLSLFIAKVGSPLQMVIDVRGDGISTYRETSPVVSIEE